MKYQLLVLALGLSILVCGCTATKAGDHQVINGEQVRGRWLMEVDGQVMRDPQTSGLTYFNEQLMTLSDRSAHPTQRLRLHSINPKNAKLNPRNMPMTLAEELKNGCFADYLATNPDLEALVADPWEPGVFFTVTEDAADQGPLIGVCHQRFSETGSTDYPTLLVRLEIQSDDRILMSHVRPVQFAPAFKVGNFPNDGIEGLALGPDRTLYFGLEKDAAGKARIFSTEITADFWQTDEFISLQEPQLNLPQFAHGNHPINALAFYPNGDTDYLFAAARNDETLWLIDLSGNRETRIIELDFAAPVKAGTHCPHWEFMNNTSIEGLAVVKQTLWLINDPWKNVYMHNVQCEQNRANYQMMAPLLFKLPIQAKWFE